MGWAGNVWTGVERWIAAERTWERLLRRLPKGHWIELHYESLIGNPEAELARICAFLGVSYARQMLDYPSSSTYSAPDPELTQQWKRKLSHHQVGLIETRVGELLVERGYEPSGLPALRVSKRAERRLRRQDRWAKMRFRVHRFGAVLVATDYLLRRLGLRWLHKPIQLRINQITDGHLR
jgi:hypothetical protein